VTYLASPALLTMPDYYGTLAAARELGKRGIQIVTAGSSSGEPTAKSRFVSQHLTCPKETNPDTLLEWLTQYGQQHPNTVLYPTSDDYAWLQSTYRPQLEKYFQMYSPDAQALENVLDKRKLSDACTQVGLDTPTTYFAESDAEVQKTALSARYPLLLKQRTQVFSDTKSKGSLVHRPDELSDAYKKYMTQNKHSASVLKHMPYSSWPLLQEYYADARAGNYLVSGFVNRDHTQIVAQAAVKVLQYPRSLGIALCLERAQIDEEITQKLLALCKATGYFGVFQIEFLVANGRRMLNDFNPRFYHYLEFDIARGLPLPWLAYLGACGDEVRLADEMTKARLAADKNDRSAFTCRSKLYEMTWAQRLTGTMSREEFSYWQSWHKKNRGNIVYALANPTDTKPEISTIISSVLTHLRHPRAFIRKIALDRISF
jgi:D-aspartate ligase